MMILYPDFVLSDKTEVLNKFIAKPTRDPFNGLEIEPDDLEFGYPDFGFNNELLFISEDDT